MKNNIYKKLFTFNEKWFPFILFLACLFAYGLVIPRLGFYMDDWHYVFYARSIGLESLINMMAYDSRPFVAPLYMLGFLMLGSSRFAWHIFTFLLIWISGISFWQFQRTLWNDQIRNAIYISLLFVVYPFFMLHSSPVGYTHLWVGLIAYLVSMIFMMKSQKAIAGYRWLLSGSALGLCAFHLFVSEYFSGLELLRPIILWIFLSNTSTIHTRHQLIRVFRAWIPYVVIFIIFFYWRIKIFEAPEGLTRNDPIILSMFFSDPIKALSFLASAIVTDSIAVLTMGWQESTKANLFKIDSVYSQFRLMISFASASLSYFYFSMISPKAVSEENIQAWSKQSMFVAITALATSGLPIWIIGRSFSTSSNIFSSTRFGFSAVIGAAILILLILNFFVEDIRKKNLLVAVLIGISVNFHLNTAKDFIYSWEKQKNFIQQLLWRIPTLTPGTALITDQEIVGRMGEYAVSFSINSAYQARNVEKAPPYWYFPYLYTNPDVEALLQGVPLSYNKLSMQFNGTSKQMILLDFNPELDRCLWILQPQDTNLRLLNSEVRRLAVGSNLSLIELSTEEISPPEELYGEQNSKTWCYFFQKADLARQFAQWDEIVQLWKSAQSVGERPDNGFEYIPFIEGFGQSGDWQKVKELTNSSNRVTSGLEPSLCSALDRLKTSAPVSIERDNTINLLKLDLKCSSFQ